MTANDGSVEAGRLKEIGQLGRAEAGGDADRAIVKGNRVPAEQGSGEGQKGPGEPAAFEIVDDDAEAGDGGEGLEQPDDRVVLEVMEKQVGHDEVERARGEGEGEGVGGDAGPVAEAEVGFGEVEADDPGVRQGCGMVGRGGSNVEDSEPRAGERAEDSPQRLAAAEEAIDPLEVAEIGGDLVGRC